MYLYAYICLCFCIYICYISQRNTSAFSLMHGSDYACHKSIWNSHQKHIKAIRKIKNINPGEKLFEAYFGSARLPDYTRRHYPHVKRELFNIRADGNKKKKRGDVEVCAVRSVSFTYSSGGALFTCYVFRQQCVGHCWLLQSSPGGKQLPMDAAHLHQRLKGQERLWDSKDTARPACFEEKWCDCVLGL